jgi:DNA-binding CsgD family transcriptional regulator
MNPSPPAAVRPAPAAEPSLESFAAIITPSRSAAALADLIDEPLLGLGQDGALLAANRAAWRLLDRGDTLALVDGRPMPADAVLRGRWPAALAEAARGRRALLWARGEFARPIVLQPGAPSTPVVLRVGRDAFGRLRMVGAYAQSIGLTAQETRVLEAIVDGDAPSAIAARHRVSIATVRTQVRSVIAKAGVRGMRELVVAVVRLAS